MDVTAAVVSFGGIAGFGSSSLTRVDDIIPPGVVADTECIEFTRTAPCNLITTVVPEIVVGVECAGKSANTNGVPASTFCGNTTMTATAAIKSRRAARPRGGKVRAAAAAAAAVSPDGIAEFGLNSSTQLGDSISPGMVVDAGCAGNTTGRITTPTSTDIVAPLLSRPTSRSLKRPRKDTTQLEKGWKASSEYQWFVDMKTQFKLDNVISDSLLWVSHENYIKQFDISRVGDAICKACKGVQPMQDTMLDTFCTAVGRNYPGHRNVEQVEGYSESVFLPLDTDSFKAPLSGLSVSPALSETGATAADILCHLDSATPQTQLVSYGTGHFWCVWTQDPIVDDLVEPQYCHGDVKGGQEYDGGHLLDTLASAAEYVEGRRSIDEQDAAHMSPEVCRGDSGQMDSSHSDYYGQTSSYHSNLDMLAASATLDVVDCLKCPTALQQLCDIALDDGPLLLPAWSFKRADTEHFPIPVSLISNTLPAPSAAAAASPLPASPSLLPVLISATVATPAVGSGPARYNNKRAAAEFTDSDTIIAAAPKRLCKS
ncbi:hypothetical protein BASA83_009786 [Batrachochytrium salamandrivorans]|nr:hypothetical protein BASA83_009786 [Batrachochytrium salamandrivorans]